MFLGDIEQAGYDRIRRRFGRLRADPDAFAVVEEVARERGVSKTALLGRSRGQGRDAAARHLAMYLIHVLLERTQEQVAQLFCRERSTVTHACGRIEDLRDEREIEEEIGRIEARLAARGVLEDDHG